MMGIGNEVVDRPNPGPATCSLLAGRKQTVTQPLLMK